MHGVILKDDKRYYYTEAYLKRQGFIFFEAVEAEGSLDFIIFPFMGEVDRSIYNDSYFASLRSDVVIFSGVLNEYLVEMCKKYGLSYHAMANVQSVKIKNATPTSEGVIAHLITNRNDTISNSRILIIGYGVCGSDLAKKLRLLGADVYVLVRNKEKEDAAYTDAITPIYLGEILDEVGFNVIINTVPSRVLTNEMIDKMAETLFIDIASKPYGFDIEHAKKVNEKSTVLPGIPGKYAVRSAGVILGEFIEATLRGR